MSERAPSFFPAALAAGLLSLLAACSDDVRPAATDAADAVADAADSSPEDAAGDVAPDAVDDAADTHTPPPDVSAQVAACTSELARGQSFLALGEAEAALALAPDDQAANFCAALAGLIDRTEFALSIASVLDMASTYNGLVVPEPTYGDELAEDIHGVFNYLHAGYALSAERLAKVTDPALAFDVDVVWLYSGAHPILAYRGRFDAGDVKLMRVMARFVAGFLDILRGQDLRGDVATLVSFVANDLTGGGFDLGKIADMVAMLLASDERFLALHPEDGHAAFLEAREVLADLGPDLRDALATIEAQRPVPGVDEVTDVELIGEDYVLTARHRVVRDDAGALVEEPVVVALAARTLAALDKVSDSVRHPGTLVPWDGGVTQLLGLMLGTLIETGGLGTLEFGGFALEPGFFSYEQIGDLLAAVVPSPALFDFGAFYANPVGLRAILPRAEARGGFGKDGFIGEWECPGELGAGGKPAGPQGIACTEGAELVDAPHFVGTPDEIAADGYLSRFAYFAADDPTLNGLLWADLTGLYPGAPEGPAPATAATVNIIMAETFVPLLSLFGDD